MKTRILPLLLGGILAPQILSAAPLSFVNGDILLCFRQTDNGEEYLVKVGTMDTFENVTGSIVIGGLGNIAADLSGIFGASWHEPGSTVFWSASGSSGISGALGEPARTMFATKGQVTFGTVTTGWGRASATTQSAPEAKIRTMGGAYAGQPVHESTANSPVGYRRQAGDTSSYNSYQVLVGGVNTSSFAYFPGGIEGNFDNGAAAAGLDLFRLQPGSGAGEYLGTFTITSAGVLTFTKVVATQFDARVTDFTVSGGSATITGSGTPNAAYRIQRSTDLAGWTTITSPTVTANSGGVITFTDNAAPAGRAFYRIAAP